MNKEGSSRIRVLSVLVLLSGIFLVGRLYYVQIAHGDEFSHKADRQYVRPNQALFDRGDIYFTTKDGEKVSAATLKTGFIISINPSILKNPEDVYQKLSNHLEIDREDFLRRAARDGDPYEEIVDRVDGETAKNIKDLDIEGVGVHKERWRYYPGGQMAAQSIGLVAYSTDELAGRYGLERYYEQILNRDESNVYVNFFAEIFSNIRESISYSEDREGDIVTTIEPNVQAFVEQELVKLDERWKGEMVGAVVIDPNTGEIIAMASLPTFNPNDLSEISDISVFKNPLVENVYEMGSIVKAITLAAGIDSGAVTPETTYYDAGYLVLDGYKIENHDKKGHGTIDMQEVINKSLNTGAAFIVDQIGNDKFAEYLFDFGFGKKSGVDLPDDTAGLVSNLKSPRNIEYATASYGQGIAVSPISIVKSLSALANGGEVITPHLVKEIDPDNGLAYEVEPEARRVIKESTSTTIARVLTKAVDEALLGGTVSLERYSVAAKTGTAQISSQSGGYSENEFLHTFFGYFPAYDPKFLVFLIDQNPRGAQYASDTLTHSFMDITEFLINYYDIPPDR